MNIDSIRRGVLTLALTISTAQHVCAEPTPYPTSPAVWPGSGVVRVFSWMNDNRAYFWAQRHLKQGAIVFAGDSLTGGWQELEKAFPGLNVANRGIGGDVSRGLLFRFQEDVLALHPKAVVLLIGSADLSALQPTKDTEANIELMLKAAKAHRADMPVILCTIPPRDNPQAPVARAVITDLNNRIKALTARYTNVHLLDLHAILSNGNDTIDERYFHSDRLHINPQGYAAWQREIAPVFEQLKIH